MDFRLTSGLDQDYVFDKALCPVPTRIFSCAQARLRHSSAKGLPGPHPALWMIIVAHKSAPSIESMPWFATDDLLGATLLGPDRVGEFRQLVTLLEGQGFPKIDPLMGGRYVPAVKAYFDHQYHLGRGGPPLAPDGVEDFKSWKTKSKPRG